MKGDSIGIAALLILVAIFYGAYLVQLGCPVEAIEETPGTHETHEQPSENAPDAPRSTLPTPGSPHARELNAPGGTAQRDVEVLRGMVGQLLLVVKEPNRPPLGINEDFARALTGANKANLIVIPPGHPAVAGGKIVDRWGSPYFFHPRAASAIDIRSAGPDRKLFTEDDIVPSVGIP